MENTSLTRYQLARSFIYLMSVALSVAWFFMFPEIVFKQLAYYTPSEFPFTRIAAFTSPLLLLLFWPFIPVLARAMSGSRANELVASARELRSLLLPCLGAILIIQSIINIGFSAAHFLETYGNLRDMYGEERTLFDWIIGTGVGFFQCVYLLTLGLPITIWFYFRARRFRHENVIQAPSKPAAEISLTRFEITRAFVFLMVFSVLLNWLLLFPFQLVYFFRNFADMASPSGYVRLVASLVILFLLPFASILSNAMTGEKGAEIVASPRDLQPLKLPCAAIAFFILVLRYVPVSFAGIYDDYGAILAGIPIWWLFFRVLFTWPAIKCSLGLAVAIYPSIRDLVRQTTNKVNN